MGGICPHCGEGLPRNEQCPCQAIDDSLDDLRPRRAAKREQDRKRRDQMRAAGPVESFTTSEIGNRDGWVCGICQDTSRLVDPGPHAPRALSSSLDHIIPVSGGGQHARANVRIAHLWCNVERNSGEVASSEYMRAQLSRLLDRTPVPEELHRSRFPSRRWPASPRIEYMIALYITAGKVAADPRYGEPATRLTDTARQLSGDDAEDTLRRGLNWIDEITRRRSPVDARWRSAQQDVPELPGSSRQSE